MQDEFLFAFIAAKMINLPPLADCYGRGYGHVGIAHRVQRRLLAVPARTRTAGIHMSRVRCKETFDELVPEVDERAEYNQPY